MVDRGGLENRCALAGTQGSNPCLSAIKPDYQVIKQTTPNFAPSFGREIGCFVWRLIGRKEGKKFFILPFVPSQKEEYGSTPTLV